MATAAERVDTAYHLVRHQSVQRSANMLGELRAACAVPAPVGARTDRGCGPETMERLDVADFQGKQRQREGTVNPNSFQEEELQDMVGFGGMAKQKVGKAAQGVLCETKLTELEGDVNPIISNGSDAESAAASRGNDGADPEAQVSRNSDVLAKHMIGKAVLNKLQKLSGTNNPIHNVPQDDKLQREFESDLKVKIVQGNSDIGEKVTAAILTMDARTDAASDNGD